MCSIAVLIDVLADAPVAIAANRDELYARPARAPVTLAPGVIGGHDDAAGGSWLAITHDGRFAAVTNQREGAMTKAPRSRGEWVTGALAAGDRAAMRAFVERLDPQDYASGNLVLGDASGVDVYYLRRDGRRERVVLPRGVTVVANDRIDAPGQPKQARLAAAVADVGSWLELRGRARAALGDHAIPDTLPLRPPGLPVPATAWPALQSVCVHTEHYGTRNATVAALRPGGVVGLAWADGPPCTTAFTAVAIPSPDER